LTLILCKASVVDDPHEAHLVIGLAADGVFGLGWRIDVPVLN
jgi:hypothetical protein